jgi:peptidoglycan/xylan/chitin deacetylase (PgdA/CDA1 family)
MALKQWLKSTSGRLLRPWIGGDPSGRVVVLCYHSIHPTKSLRSATPESFERHLRWLKEHCDVIPFCDVFKALEAQGRNRPTVAITFDDGFADNYEYALPVLQKHKIPATFFLIAGLLEKDAAVLERVRVLYRSSFEDTRPLEWSQVCEMHKAGMEIGAHTFSHPNLARLNRNEAKIEMQLSKEIIEQRLGAAVASMAYPFGKPRRHFKKETVEVAGEVGFAYAASVQFRAVRPDSSRMNIPRFLTGREEPGILGDMVFGGWDLVGLWQEKIPLAIARIISPRDFAV